MKSAKLKSVDAYIQKLAPVVADKANKIRALILNLYPKVIESIRYDMPAYAYNGTHLYFAVYKNHIGIYPIYPNTDLEPEIKQYRGKTTKDALHFKHTEELPMLVIKKIIEFKFKS